MQNDCEIQKNRIFIGKMNKVTNKNRNVLNMVKYMQRIKKSASQIRGISNDAGKEVSHDIV